MQLFVLAALPAALQAAPLLLTAGHLAAVEGFMSIMPKACWQHGVRGACCAVPVQLLLLRVAHWQGVCTSLTNLHGHSSRATQEGDVSTLLVGGLRYHGCQGYTGQGNPDLT